MMENVLCLNKSCDRLEKYHFLTQQWVDRVMITVSGKKAHAILNNLLSMLSSFFNYSESEGEMDMYIHHYQSYHNSFKEDLKSDHGISYLATTNLS